MRLKLFAGSGLALALFYGIVPAQSGETGKAPPAQSQDNLAAAIDAAMQILSDQRAASELSPKELGRRVKLAERSAGAEGLPEDLRARLVAVAEAGRAEIANRESQQAQPDAPPPQPEAAPAQPEAAPAQPPAAAQQQPEAAPAPSQPTAQAPMPRALSNLLADERPVESLSDEDLNRRLRRAQQFMSLPDIQPETVGELRKIAANAERELLRRQTSAAPPAPAQPQTGQAEQGQEPAAPPKPPRQPKPPVAEVSPVVPPPAPPVQVQVDAKDAQRLDANVADPEAEARAREYLDDRRPAQRLSDEQLRERLDGIRDVLAGNELSRGTERALRQKLMKERDILRQRVAAAEAQAQQQLEDEQQAQGQQQGKRRSRWAEEAPADWQWTDRQALNDRRASEELKDYELRRRLDVYRRAANDKRYEAQYRDYWRSVIDRDQYVLQQRLVEARRARQAEMRAGDDVGFNLNIGIGRRPPPQDVFAAEVDDQGLADVLVAQPRRKFKRRYTIDEIEQQPEVRAALPRVELDTIKFGFNEAFVRPEEIDKLDRIGEILERILSRNPGEVFLIEGHTDAVGSDAANLALSRKRAEAVKRALTTYYLIPGSSIRTAGFGERYLKIPTAEPEAENRRVSVSRATDVIGLQ